MKQRKKPIASLALLVYPFLALLTTLLLSAGCQKKEEPKVQEPYPSAPIHAANEIKILEKAAEQDPKSLSAWTGLGNALMDNHRYREAIDAYQKALHLDQKDVDVRVDMGTCYKNIGQFDRAVEEYRNAIKINPRHVNAHRNLGVVLGFDLGDKSEAIKQLEESLRLSPYGAGADNARKMIEELKK